MYLYRMTVGEERQTGRMVLIDGQAGRPTAGSGGSAVAVESGGEAAPVYGLTVSGPGLIPLVDPAFRVEAGQGPVDFVVAVPGSTPRATGAATGILGDVDNNVQVDFSDALLVALYSKDASLVLPHHGAISLGDVNADGQVDRADAWLISAYGNDPSDPTLPAGIGKRVSSATASLSPDPSTVSFADDGIWHRFTVQASESVSVVVNPGATRPRLELTTRSGRDNYCPGGADDAVSREDSEAIYLAGCASGTATVELRRESDDTVLQTYTFTVTASPADLVVSASVSASSLTSGQSFTLSATVRNQGTASASATTLRYYRSSNRTISWQDTQVGSDAVSALAASATSAESISLTAPSDVGTYYYGACVERKSGESAGNNCSTGVRVTVGGTSPDLVVQSASVNDNILTTGQAFILRATVQNQGTDESPELVLSYYRSSNATISTQDTQVGTDEVGSLAASSISAESISLTAPSTPGIYYYGACVATVAGEADTGNNCSSSSAVTVRDGSRVEKLLEVKAQDPEEYAALAALSWIQDGVSASESYAVSTLTEAALLTDRVFSALLEKPWIRDGLTADEAFAIDELVNVARRQRISVESTLRILEMPFLDTFETLDYYAVRCLNFLDREMDGRYLQQVLDHPSLSGGITDMDTVILTGLWRIARFSPENVESSLILLDPDQVYLQERTIALPLAGETTLTVLRVTPGTFRTIDMMEEILRQYEAFMNVAYPYKISFIFNVDSEGGPRATAGNGIVTLNPGYEEDVYLLTHELAHAYWQNPSAWWQAAYSKGITFTPFTWIAEGAASFLDVTFVVDITTDSLRNAPTWPSDTGCSLFDTIGELDQKTYTPSPDESLEGGALYRSACNYNMGYGLFADLYKRLGDTEFRKGFGSLYTKMSNLEHDDECTGVERGVCYVRKAFVEDASPGFAEAADEVINRWYYGGEPF